MKFVKWNGEALEYCIIHAIFVELNMTCLQHLYE